jgi:hypothetical protein
MFGLTITDIVPQVQDIISVGEFYEKAAGVRSRWSRAPKR